MEVVAVSTDERVDAVRMVQELGTEFPVLADPEGRIVKSFGVFDLLGDGVAAPATFIIGKDRSIALSHISRTIGGRPSAEDVLDRLNELEVSPD